jgi:signal recognition particle subunit SRP54
MQELSDIDQAVQTTEKILVVDGMAGQESVNISKTFDEKIGISGVVLTKLDGDTRGGAALSVAYTTQRPIYFIGTGEKLSDIELFHPDRMASRILGMGDVLSLIDKAQDMVDEEQAKIMEQKIRNASFDLNDFVDQLHQVQKLGPLSNVLEMLPGVNKKALAGLDMAATEKQTKRTEAIIFSMTPEERSKPDIINGSRRKRIANGSGTSVADVNRLLKGFEQSRKMMKQMGNMGKKKRNKMKWPFM